MDYKVSLSTIVHILSLIRLKTTYEVEDLLNKLNLNFEKLIYSLTILSEIYSTNGDSFLDFNINSETNSITFEYDKYLLELETITDLDLFKMYTLLSNPKINIEKLFDDSDEVVKFYNVLGQYFESNYSMQNDDADLSSIFETDEIYIEYIKLGNSQPSTYKIKPLSFGSGNDGDTVEAYDYEDSRIKTFLIDRIINLSEEKNLKSLKKISNTLSELLNEPKLKNAPYVGENAFSHKGGLHASAVAKDPSTYEHINPDLVGNSRNVIISDQAGKANLISQLKKLEIDIDSEKINQILELIKQKETEGFSYDTALASFELLVRRHVGQIKEYFNLNKFRVTDERRWNAKGELVTESEATVQLEVKNEEKLTVGIGNGPVNAIDSALRQALIDFYPSLKDLTLTDYKVMILSSEKGTGAITRVHIESTDDTKKHWTTVGVSTNIIDASYNAIFDSITFKLFNDLNK